MRPAELEMTREQVEPETSLMALLRRSDFVSMHAPLNAQTRHMLSTPHFEAASAVCPSHNHDESRTCGID